MQNSLFFFVVKNVVKGPKCKTERKNDYCDNRLLYNFQRIRKGTAIAIKPVKII